RPGEPLTRSRTSTRPPSRPRDEEAPRVRAAAKQKATAKPSANRRVPVAPVPEAKIIRRRVGVPPMPVPQDDGRPKPVLGQAPGPALEKEVIAAGPDAAKPARRGRAKVKLTPDRLEQLVNAARTSLEDDKAEDIVVLDVTDRASFTDRMIIATGFVDRQIQAMASHLQDALEKVGMKLRRDSIQASDDWVLIDCGDMVIHLFKAEARATYALERMWGPESPPGGPGSEDSATLMDGDQLPE
ncbi:MAG: rsfS, partial [Belnapia sp.]|nr:rsfS [Belnapia sp.]